MGEEPVIASLLETEEGLELLDQEELEGDIGNGIGQIKAYEDFRDHLLGKPATGDLPGYINSANRVAEEPLMAYREGLLEPGVEERVEDHLELLRENRERSLNVSEREAVISTAINEEVIARQALDKEKLMDRMYTAVYSNEANLPESAFSEYDERVA